MLPWPPSYACILTNTGETTVDRVSTEIWGKLVNICYYGVQIQSLSY